MEIPAIVESEYKDWIRVAVGFFYLDSKETGDGEPAGPSLCSLLQFAAGLVVVCARSASGPVIIEYYAYTARSLSRILHMAEAVQDCYILDNERTSFASLLHCI